MVIDEKTAKEHEEWANPIEEIMSDYYALQIKLNDLIAKEMMKLGLKKRLTKDAKRFSYWASRNNVVIKLTQNVYSNVYTVFKNNVARVSFEVATAKGMLDGKFDMNTIIVRRRGNEQRS